jgi:hypothetical protein
MKLYEEGIAKNFPADFSGEAAVWGKDVHKALHQRIELGAELPSNMVQYEPRVKTFEDMAKQLGYTMYPELALAVNQSLQPCDWKDWDNCWSRCALDLLMMSMSKPDAVAIDWKTGKVKDDDRQLALQAAMVFRHYPHVNRVVSMFIWLKEDGRMTKVTFTRANEPRLWKQYLPVVRELTDAVTFGNWPAKPSGLCREYCPVNTCKSNGAYRP